MGEAVYSRYMLGSGFSFEYSGDSSNGEGTTDIRLLLDHL